MNKDLLFQLYAIHSKSGNEKKMRRFLRKQARNCGATSIETDKNGNLLIIKGESKTYPCLAAHMDQVQNFHSDDFRVVEIGDDVLGWSPKCHQQQGLGADDKNGIFICLELLRKFDAIKVAFFVGEETGCVGSRAVDLSFFKDCRFIIEPDRMHGHDLITSMFCGDVCSEEFVKAIGADKFGYKEDRGSITDVGTLVKRGVGISCLNLSCGYYDAHTDHEITILSELENCMKFVEHIVETCEEVYPFEGGYGYYGRGYGRYGYGSRNWDMDYDYGYGSFCGKKYDGAKEKSLLFPTVQKQSTKMASSLSTNFLDDEDYFTNGEYDEDLEMMHELIASDPNLTFEDIYNDWIMNFNTRDLDFLSIMYDEELDELTRSGDYWNGEDDDLAGELSFDDNPAVLKVS